MTHDHKRFFVVTGGPGAGKTTLIDALAARGFGRKPEAGRAITQAQVAIGGRAVHWADRALYAELMLMHEMRNHAEALATAGPVFFDRGVPELIGYLELSGLAVPPHFEKAAELCRYNKLVFAAPPWREIFVNDAERKQDFAEALETYGLCKDAYRRLGYEVVELPRASVEERVGFVLGHVDKLTARN